MSGLERLQPRPLGDGVGGFSAECFSFLRLGDTFLPRSKQPRAVPRGSACGKGERMGGERGRRRGAGLAAPMGAPRSAPGASTQRGAGGTRLPSAPLSHRFPLVALGGAGRHWDGRAAGTGMCWEPRWGTGRWRGTVLLDWDMLGAVGSALGHAGAPALGTERCWDILGYVALALGCAGMCRFCTGTHWDTRPRHRDVLGCTDPALGLTGTQGPSTGMCWDVQILHWDT